jgi:hypothetical protein
LLRTFATLLRLQNRINNSKSIKDCNHVVVQQQQHAYQSKLATMLLSNSNSMHINQSLQPCCCPTTTTLHEFHNLDPLGAKECFTTKDNRSQGNQPSAQHPFMKPGIISSEDLQDPKLGVKKLWLEQMKA